jgi:uncharacterized protein with PQ loop repeat
MSHTILGVFGVILLASSGIPQLIRTIRVKKVTGLSPYSLCCVFFGCVCMSLYTMLEEGFSIFHGNYFVNGLVSATNLLLYFNYRNKSQ